jgi:hypothetical protein
MKYIRQIHLDAAVPSPAYISRIRYSYTVNGPLYEQKCADVVRAIEARIADYCVRSDRTGEERPVTVRMSFRGTKTIATTPDDSLYDKLLTLESF